MIKLDIEDGYYDASELINQKGYATLGEVLQDICNKKGVECGSTSFLNSDKQVAVYDNQITAREYLSYIAESAGGFACVGRDGKLYIKCLYENEETIPLRLFKTYKFSEEFKVSKVSYEDGIRSFKFGDDTNNTLWINQENMFVIDEDQVEKIYNQVKELTINSFEGTVVINPALDVGDKIIIDGKPIVYQGEITLNGRFIAEIKSKIDIKQKQETSVKKESQKIINRRVQSEINQIEGTITQLAKETTENTEKITEVEQTAEGITQNVSKVETKVETVEKKADNAQSTANTANTNAQNAQTSADNAQSTADNINKSLTDNYYTKTQTNSQIKQESDNITSSVSKNIATAKQEAIDSSNASTDEKLLDYSTTEQMRSEIQQTADTINLEVEGKLNEEDFTGANIMLAVNNDSSTAQIKADKVNLDGYVTISNLQTEGQTTINGSNITTGKIDASKVTVENLNADNITSGTITGRAINGGAITGTKISNGNNFSVDENGNMSCSNGTFTNGTILLNNPSGSGGNLEMKGSTISQISWLRTDQLYLSDDGASINLQSSGESGQVGIYISDYGYKEEMPTNSNDAFIGVNTLNSADMSLSHNRGNDEGQTTIICKTDDDKAEIWLLDNKISQSTYIRNSGITTPTVTQTSLESEKKNFEKLQSGLDIIKNIDIYKYNLKSEDDNTKKHIGFVIGDNYNYSKEVTSNNNDGVDIYSFVAVCCKAIQEQQEQIENQNNLIQDLIKRIEKLEGGNNE